MRNRGIPKEPAVPAFTDGQIEHLTEIVFSERKAPAVCDAVFVFGGTHPGHWEKAVEAYRLGLSDRFIVTGGIKPSGEKHANWADAQTPEADVIVSELRKAGIAESRIFFENRSTNTLENVLFAKEVFPFHTVSSLLVVCKNHGAGRQIRTLQQNIQHPITYIPFGFDAEYHHNRLSRTNWTHTEKGRSRVWGEYLRIVYLGSIGHVLPLEKRVEGLDDVLANIFFQSPR